MPILAGFPSELIRTLTGMENFTFSCVEQDGTRREIAITPAQALDLGAGEAIAYTPRDEQILVNDDGTITRRESAVPEQADAA